MKYNNGSQYQYWMNKINTFVNLGLKSYKKTLLTLRLSKNQRTTLMKKVLNELRAGIISRHQVVHSLHKINILFDYTVSW